MMLFHVLVVLVTKVGNVPLYDPYSYDEGPEYQLSTTWLWENNGQSFEISDDSVELWYTDAYGQDGLINWTIKDLV